MLGPLYYLYAVDLLLAGRMKPCIGSDPHLALDLGKSCFHRTGNKAVGSTYLGGLQCWNRFCFVLGLGFGLERLMYSSG